MVSYTDYILYSKFPLAYGYQYNAQQVHLKWAFNSVRAAYSAYSLTITMTAYYGVSWTSRFLVILFNSDQTVYDPGLDPSRSFECCLSDSPMFHPRSAV